VYFVILCITKKDSQEVADPASNFPRRGQHQRAAQSEPVLDFDAKRVGQNRGKLKTMLDQEYSKLFRHGFDLVVNEGFKNGKIDRKTYDEYWTTRRLFRDEDFGTSTHVEIDLAREPTDEEIRSAA
jgi:hypothetical protein